MEPFTIFLIVVILLLTTVLVIAGIQVILILGNLNRTLGKLNRTIESAEFFLHNISNPLSDVKSLGQGVKTGLHVAEYIVSWIKDKKGKEEAHE
jgi:hypothetical protein